VFAASFPINNIDNVILDDLIVTGYKNTIFVLPEYKGLVLRLASTTIVRKLSSIDMNIQWFHKMMEIWLHQLPEVSFQRRGIQDSTDFSALNNALQLIVSLVNYYTLSTSSGLNPAN
jgi:hypothetical protein